MIGTRWKEIDPERLAHYKARAKKETERYTQLVKEYQDKVERAKRQKVENISHEADKATEPKGKVAPTIPVLQKTGVTADTKVKYSHQNISRYDPCIIESCVNDEFGNLNVKDIHYDLLPGTEGIVCFDADGPLIENNGIGPVFIEVEQQNIAIPSVGICDDIPFSTIWD
eukprot:6158650-Ditylum_brightwellii.AAC.1